MFLTLKLYNFCIILLKIKSLTLKSIEGLLFQRFLSSIHACGLIYMWQQEICSCYYWYNSPPNTFHPWQYGSVTSSMPDTFHILVGRIFHPFLFLDNLTFTTIGCSEFPLLEALIFIQMYDGCIKGIIAWLKFMCKGRLQVLPILLLWQYFICFCSVIF